MEGLEKLLSTNKSAIEKEQVSWKEFGARKTAIEQKKREVEDGIMRGLSGDGPGAGMSPISPIGGGGGDPRMNGAAGSPVTPGAEPDRPDVEELTPPPEDPPVTTTAAAAAATTTTAAASSTFEPTPGSDQPQDPRMRNQALTPDTIPLQQQQQSLNGLLPPTYAQPLSHSVTPQPQPPPAPQQQHPQLGADLLSSLNLPPVRPYSGSPPGAPASKKRKVDDEEAGAVFGSAAGQGEGDVMAGLDDDVAELLRQESGSGSGR